MCKTTENEGVFSMFCVPVFLTRLCPLCQVFKNLQLFMENKQPEDDLFDRLNVSNRWTYL